MGKHLSRLKTRKGQVVLGAVVIILPLFSYISVEATSVPGLCRSCHEIEAAVQSWERSPHRTVDGKERADCRDCHVPGWKRPWAVIRVKLYHGVRDTYSHLTGKARPEDPKFYFELKHDALKDVGDDVCLSCHEKVRHKEQDVIKTEEGEVRGLHTSEAAAGVACITCHKNTGHDIYQ